MAPSAAVQSIAPSSEHARSSQHARRTDRIQQAELVNPQLLSGISKPEYGKPVSTVRSLSDSCSSIKDQMIPPYDSARQPTWVAELLSALRAGLQIAVSSGHAGMLRSERMPDAYRAAHPDNWHAQWLDATMRFLINSVNADPHGHDELSPSPQSIKAQLTVMHELGSGMLAAGQSDEQVLTWLQNKLIHLFQRKTGIQFTAELFGLQIDAGTSFNTALVHIEQSLMLSAVMHPDDAGRSSNDTSRKHALINIIGNYYPELYALVKPEQNSNMSSSQLLSILNQYRHANLQACNYVNRGVATLTKHGVIYSGDISTAAADASGDADAEYAESDVDDDEFAEFDDGEPDDALDADYETDTDAEQALDADVDADDDDADADHHDDAESETDQ